MEENIFKYVLDYGSLGVMSALLFWLYRQAQIQMEKIREQSREDIEVIRKRYDEVVSKYDQERQRFFDERTQHNIQLVAQHEKILERIQDLAQQAKK